jgi:hypothetical protein
MQNQLRELLTIEVLSTRAISLSRIFYGTNYLTAAIPIGEQHWSSLPAAKLAMI